MSVGVPRVAVVSPEWQRRVPKVGRIVPRVAFGVSSVVGGSSRISADVPVAAVRVPR